MKTRSGGAGSPRTLPIFARILQPETPKHVNGHIGANTHAFGDPDTPWYKPVRACPRAERQRVGAFETRHKLLRQLAFPIPCSLRDSLPLLSALQVTKKKAPPPLSLWEEAQAAYIQPSIHPALYACIHPSMYQLCVPCVDVHCTSAAPLCYRESQSHAGLGGWLARLIAPVREVLSISTPAVSSAPNRLGPTPCWPRDRNWVVSNIIRCSAPDRGALSASPGSW